MQKEEDIQDGCVDGWTEVWGEASEVFIHIAEWKRPTS